MEEDDKTLQHGNSSSNEFLKVDITAISSDELMDIFRAATSDRVRYAIMQEMLKRKGEYKE